MIYLPGVAMAFRLFSMLASFFVCPSGYGSDQASTLIIGDSIFALTGEVPKNLKEAGLDFRMGAKSGARMKGIIRQYISYREEYGAPSLVIFNGGGNDILIDGIRDCAARNPRCDDLVHGVVVDTARLISIMHDDGVERAIYLGIHLLRGPLTPLNPIINTSMDETPAMLNAAPLEIDFVDPRPLFKGRKNLHMVDMVHPNARGSKIISDLILEAI